MKIKLLIFAIAITFCSLSSSQDVFSDNIVGSNISFRSEIMNDERQIQIHLPHGYNESDKEYPVLYVLDGQRYFLHAVSLQQTFAEFKQTPDFIVVGISKNVSDRNRIYSTSSNIYSSFIEAEVLQLIDSKYRTSKERVLFGWAFGGGFTLEMMLTKPYLFDAYIAASPFPIEHKIPEIDSLIEANSGLGRLLFFTSGISEGLVKKGTNQLNDLLSNKVSETSNWEFIEFEKEEHRSTPFTTMYHGLRKYFYYYPELQFSNLKEFLEAGGMDYTYEYYNKRSERYGFSKELSDWTMFSILRNAIRANDYSQFENLMNKFSPSDFISRLRVSRAYTIGEFYANNNQFDKAKSLFLLIAKQNPNSTLPLKGLGDVYMKLGDEKKANSYYKKAESLNE